MHLIRRAAFRAASSSPATSFISKSRSITTSSPFLLRSKTQSGIPSSVFRRFASDNADSSSEQSGLETGDGEHSAVRSAIDSASEAASSAAASGSVPFSEGAEEVGAAEGRPRQGYSGGDRYPYERRSQNDYDNRRGEQVSGRQFGAPLNLTPTSSIYVGNLLFDITAEDLKREFEQYGPVKSATIAADARGLSKGFGYVEFGTTEEATNAIEAKHQSIFEGRRMIVNYMATSRRDVKSTNEPSKTLFIGNLAFEMSDADLNKLFRDIRNVIDVRVAIDRRTGQPRGFAHADFVDVESATKGLEALSQQEVYGRRLRVDYSGARSQGDRGDRSGPPGGRGGYGGRSGGPDGQRRERY